MSVATQAFLALPVLLGFAAYGVDIGWMNEVQSEVQGAADAAALAGSAFVGNPAQVRATAELVARANTAGDKTVTLTDADVRIGTWDGQTWTDDAAGSYVRVVAQSPAQPLFFASIFGYRLFAPKATSIAQRPVPTGGYPCLMFADQALTLNGTTRIDGYDSWSGPYGSTRGDTASVCTNVQNIAISGTADVYGDLHPGPGGQVTMRGASYVSGSTAALPKAVVLPPVSAPSADDHGIGKTVHCSVDVAGTYYFPNGLTVNGHGALNVTGATKIYLGADSSINGQGFVNTSGDPTSLTVYVVGAHSLKINGNSDFYGAIYAPEGNVTINGTAAFYGAVIGQSVQANGTGDIHLDTALEGGDTPQIARNAPGSRLVL